MGAKRKYDFGGFATKPDLKCADGRTIRKGAFKDCDGKIVPLVWQHMHSDPENVLGHGLLKYLEDGSVYVYGAFNDTPKARSAKESVLHGDITQLSIWANQLQQVGADVLHGDIKEVSLVLAGANPGATIDNVSFAHSDGSFETSDDEAIIRSGESLSIEDLEHAAEGSKSENTDSPTLAQVWESMNEDQKNAVAAIVAHAVSDEGEEGGEVEHSAETGGDNEMKHNVFDGSAENIKTPTLTHAQIATIFEDAQKMGSFKASVLAHAQEYGIKEIEILFPDAKTVTPTPELIKRDTEWVSMVLNGAKHAPFSRIKSTAADLTADEARAKGYVKGKLKKEEVIKVLKRVTTPTTIYKKQKLDRDDILDITEFNVVSWLMSEMRLMLNEEIARAALIGDGREPDDDDKINEENVRPIYSDDDLYSHHVAIDAETVTTEDAVLDEIVMAMENYEGNGTPAMFTTRGQVTKWLLMKDKVGRRLFNNETDLAAYIGVSGFVKVPVMKGVQRKVVTGEAPAQVTTDTYDLVGIIVNMPDYTFGTDRGGQISNFNDFDIDYNQYKYLMETRMSGCLTKPKTALVIEKKTTEITPAAE